AQVLLRITRKAQVPAISRAEPPAGPLGSPRCLHGPLDTAEATHKRAERARAASLAAVTHGGSAQTRGRQDADKAVFEDRPSSFHGGEKFLSCVAQPRRGLAGEKASITLVEGTGIKAGPRTVPPVQSRAVQPAEFNEIRARILDASPSALRIDAARAHASDRR